MPLENSKWLPSIDTGGVDLAGEAQEVTRSWYLTAEVADQLQAAANNLYHELRGRAPKHVVEALLRAGIDQPDRGADRAAVQVVPGGHLAVGSAGRRGALSPRGNGP
jgi:hypothetical protein